MCVWSCFPTFVGTHTERAAHHVRSDNFVGTKMLHHKMNSLHFKVINWVTVRQIVINIIKVSIRLPPQVMKTCVCRHVFLSLWGHTSLYTVTLWGPAICLGTKHKKSLDIFEKTFGWLTSCKNIFKKLSEHFVAKTTVWDSLSTETF